MGTVQRGRASPKRLAVSAAVRRRSQNTKGNFTGYLNQGENKGTRNPGVTHTSTRQGPRWLLWPLTSPGSITSVPLPPLRTFGETNPQLPLESNIPTTVMGPGSGSARDRESRLDFPYFYLDGELQDWRRKIARWVDLIKLAAERRMDRV